jgi:hypothetical protein
MIRLVQFFEAAGDRAVAVIDEKAGVLRLIDGYASVYELALAAIRAGDACELRAIASVSHGGRPRGGTAAGRW